MAKNGDTAGADHARHNFVGYPSQKAMNYGKETRKNDSTGINRPLDSDYNASSAKQSPPKPVRR